MKEAAYVVNEPQEGGATKATRISSNAVAVDFLLIECLSESQFFICAHGCAKGD